MWVLDNRTPFAADHTILQDENGAFVWVVVVKGTFAIAGSGEVQLGNEQMPVCQAPEYLADPNRSSLRYESEFVHTKPATDVICHAQAYASQGRRARSVEVSLTIGDRSK